MFNVVELNKCDLYNRAKNEATLIYNKPSTRAGRTLQDITATVMYGQAAEQYLIEERGFSDDPRAYKDVIDPNNQPVEVKVTEGDYYVPYVLKRANEAAHQKWREYPEWLYIFIGDKQTLDYSLYGIYQWNGTNFSLHSKDFVV